MTTRHARPAPRLPSGLVVPAVPTQDVLKKLLLDAVDGTPFDFFWLESLEAAVQIGKTELPLVVGPGVRGGPEAAAQVFDLLRSKAALQPVTTAAQGTTSFLRLARNAAGLEVLYLPRQADALRARLAEPIVRRDARELEGWIADRVPHHPLALRLAYRHLLGQSLAGPDLDPEDLPRLTAEDIATGVGVSRGHLFELQRKYGVKLSAVARTWLARLAVLARRLEGASWKQIAWRSGYRWVSGLSGLFDQVFEERLKAVERRRDRWVQARIRERMVEATGVTEDEPDSE